MSADTTTLDYWLNWRFLVCVIWVLSPTIAASVIIWKYEGSNPERHCNEENRQKMAWSPCLKEIHPAWLLAYRIFAFLILLTSLIVNVVLDGGGIFFFYTQWTYTLVTIYFGLGSLLSIYGCSQFLYKFRGDMVEQMRLIEEQGTYVAPTYDGKTNICNSFKSQSNHEDHHAHKIAGICGYAFQIIYQASAGAAMLTDVVFWLVIYPFRTYNEYSLNLLLVGMHSLNALFLLGDTALNSLSFPWFRIAYFALWTAIYVIFQWVVHACFWLPWPYPFVDLSSSYAPLWYLSVALLHIPCYAFFLLIVKLKSYLLSRWFPGTHQLLSSVPQCITENWPCGEPSI